MSSNIEQLTTGEIIAAGVPTRLGGVALNVLIKDSTEKILLCTGLTVPTDSLPGFAKGCIFIDTDVAAGTSGVYQNVGTVLLSNFDRLDSTIGAGSLTLAEGSILVGNNGGVAAAVSAKTDGKILIGNGTTVAAQSLGTDVTMNNAGAVTIANNAITTVKILDANVTAAKLANGAGVAAILTAGLGGSLAITKTTVAANNTIVAANATKDRAVIVVATVTEAFSTGTGTRTLVTVGETTTLDKLWPNTTFPDGLAVNTVLVGAFTNTSTKAITISNVAAVGDGTGGVSVAVIAIPTT